MAAQSEVMKFFGTGTKRVPVWLAVTYLSSNLVLNSLNFYWFGKMIDTIRKRFEKKAPSKPDDAEKRADAKDDKMEEGKSERVLRRRRSSIVLEVADDLQRSMMDGAADAAPVAQAETSQNQKTEDRMEDTAQSSALDSNMAPAPRDDDAAPRRR